jgi:UDP-N-acetylmuramoylalanine--D-glutamate ligase
MTKGYSFSLYDSKADFYLTSYDDQLWITHHGERLLDLTQLNIQGLHNAQNALAALALGYAIHLPIKDMISALKRFSSLPHRCQLVRTINGVNWYNDSKATNVASTLAAIEGLGQISEQKNMILIAGGQGKGANFSLLCDVVKRYVKRLILLGEDALKLGQALNGLVPMDYVDSLSDAVSKAFNQANSGDIVLLSPACASFDQFKNFEDRGHQFMQKVMQLH